MAMITLNNLNDNDLNQAEQIKGISEILQPLLYEETSNEYDSDNTQIEHELEEDTLNQGGQDGLAGSVSEGMADKISKIIRIKDKEDIKKDIEELHSTGILYIILVAFLSGFAVSISKIKNFLRKMG